MLLCMVGLRAAIPTFTTLINHEHKYGTSFCRRESLDQDAVDMTDTRTSRLIHHKQQLWVAVLALRSMCRFVPSSLRFT